MLLGYQLIRFNLVNLPLLGGELESLTQQYWGISNPENLNPALFRTENLSWSALKPIYKLLYITCLAVFDTSIVGCYSLL
jgi:hypothetical protein